MAIPFVVRYTAQLHRRPNLITPFRNISLQPQCPFSTSLPLRKTISLPVEIPPYPYGSKLTFKQADTGLYGGSTIQFGNKISKGRNKGKTRRVWRPNVRKEKLHSDALGEDIEIKVTHRVLRTIAKVGGLDQYLLGDKPARIKELGIFGWRLRWRVMASLAMKDKFQLKRQELGLEEPQSFEQFLQLHTAQEQTQIAIEHQSKRIEQ
ncbi:39S ribosomal protein L24, mitochondrial [Myotisia sp. PD_48]|nr:39S ribosomal protein L24, mitochondrial [Myotisia sp. PD_48]